MPSCSGADFPLINHYLTLRDQVHSEDDSFSILLDQKLPQFSTSFLGAPDQDAPTPTSSSSSSSHVLFAMDGVPSDAWMPANFLMSSHEPPHTPSPTSSYHPPTARNIHTTSYMAGGTVIEASPAGGMSFPEDPLSSPDIYDLDCEKHTASFYSDKDGGFGKVGVIKTEQAEFQSFDEGGVNSCMFHEDKEDLSTFMIRSLREDILRDCKELGISPNPEKWSAEDTMRWVNSVLKREPPSCDGPSSFGADPNALHVFHVPGEVLCDMSLAEFRRLSFYGEFLHQRLEIWRMAMDFTCDPTKASQQHQHQHHPHPQTYHPYRTATTSTPTTTSTTPTPTHHHRAPAISEYGGGGGYHMPPSISPTPSTDSTCSSLSHSSSSSSSMGGGGRGGGCGAPHPSVAGYGVTHDRLEDDVIRASAAVRCKPSQPVATHPPPAHLPAPPRAPRAGKQTIHLWQFLRELLDDAGSYHDCIKWTDRPRGIFKIEDSSKVARLWGRRKNRPAMNYDKLSRSVRQYYKKGIIRKTEHSKRLVYQFCHPYL
ncbi:uncharacterized protein LOC143300950 isoform X2 [Babylonia areolata]|uniref:uncharacterized protein LOC143300950 isoform X2 n=1 Tax=Babylonia areolata TaxID=304850 RepID=UPI003FCFE0E6